MPWPELLLVRNRTSRRVPLACRRAVIFRELAGSTRGSEQVVRKLAAVAIGHRGQNPLAVLGRLERNLRNAWKIFAERVKVIFRFRPQPVKVDLLVKPHVLFRTFRAPRVSRVVETQAVRVVYQSMPA